MTTTIFFIAAVDAKERFTFWEGNIEIGSTKKVYQLQEDLARKYHPFHNSYASEIYKLTDNRKPLDKDIANDELSTFNVLWQNTEMVNGRTSIGALSEEDNFAVILQCNAPQVVSAPSESEEVAEEARDVVGKIEQDFQKFVHRVSTRKTPSVLAHIRDHNTNQSSVHTAMLDGRFAANDPLLQSDLNVPEDVLRHTASLLRSVSILAVPLERVSNLDGTSSDYISAATTPMYINATSAVVEVKADLGSGGSDPGTQSLLSYSRFYCSHERAKIRKISCCPAFLIGIAGPWLVVMGAVLTSRTIAQLLSPYEWLGYSRLFNDQQVYRIARLLYALRLSIAELHEYYARLITPVVQPGHIHPRFCPSVTSFFSDKTEISFVYAHPFEQDFTCVTFKATRTDTQQPIVIKFVRQYGQEAHLLMAKHKMAPKLLSCTPLGDQYDDLSLVAMEFIKGQTLQDAYDPSQPLPDPVRRAIRAGLNLLERRWIRLWRSSQAQYHAC
ncbi:hypothetical protein D9757_015184 [Collybiopsis confluens]|uniref:Uncharacterized protein n=1 Tax=Collybiopsis confluens TaxID=2823264 RepID=A0A8H5CCG2_9AGAR|nr:hypothetical protein D9757_015184 [Collybiopsis confluens]